MIIGGLQALSLCDYPGTPAAVIFLQGCNLHCPFCHNGSLIPRNQGSEIYSPERVLSFLKDRRKKLSGVVVSGGEPTIQEDLLPFIATIKELDLKVKLDTNGTRPEHLQQLIRANLIDYIAMDIKAPWSKYHLLSGVAVDLKAIKTSIDCITNSRIPHHFRTTYYQTLLEQSDLEEIEKSIPAGSQFTVQQYRVPSPVA